MSAQKRYKGFTLVELLVVIAIISILLTILTPALQMAREHAKMIACSGSLKTIGIGALMYLDNYDERFHNSPNGGKWDDIGWGTTNTGKPLAPDIPKSGSGISVHAVWWGIAYNEFVQDRETFRCPSAVRVDDWYLPSEQYLYKNSSYGLNTFVRNQRLSAFEHPEEIIFCQDHVEQLLDDNGDLLHFDTNWNMNCWQWRISLQADYPDAEKEIFRHKYQYQGLKLVNHEQGLGYCNTLWLDGHVDPLFGGASDLGWDILYRWYNPF